MTTVTRDDSPLVQHVERELELLVASGDTVLGQRQAAALVEVARAFGEGGHSGGSAPFGIGALAWALRTAMSYEPLTDIGTRPDEWVEVHENNGEPVYQNARCGRVFREGAVTYALDVVAWTELCWRRPYRDLGEPAFPPLRPYVVGFTGWDSARRIDLPGRPPETRRLWHRLRWIDRTIARLRGRLVPR